MAKNTTLENALRGKISEGAENMAIDDLRSMLELMLTRIMGGRGHRTRCRQPLRTLG